MKHKILHLLILIALLPFLPGCEKYPENPNRPILPYPITIDLNETQYYNLRLIGGSEYLMPPMESTSRGIIVFHSPEAYPNEFIAYDRMPPNEPNACTDSQGNTTRLVVDGGWVVDKCNNAYYNILNGQIFIAAPDMIPDFPTDSATVFPLIQYHTQYDGNKLTITN